MFRVSLTSVDSYRYDSYCLARHIVKQGLEWSGVDLQTWTGFVKGGFVKHGFVKGGFVKNGFVKG